VENLTSGHKQTRGARRRDNRVAGRCREKGWTKGLWIEGGGKEMKRKPPAREDTAPKCSTPGTSGNARLISWSKMEQFGLGDKAKASREVRV